MRHRKRDTRLVGSHGRHKAMVRGLVGDLIERERLTTTQKRAETLVRTAEKVITLAKAGDLAATRRIVAILGTDRHLRKLTGELAKRYADRRGGYTRITKLGPRKGDAAPMVVVELVK